MPNPNQPSMRAATYQERMLDRLRALLEGRPDEAPLPESEPSMQPTTMWDKIKEFGSGLAEQPVAKVANLIGDITDQGMRGRTRDSEGWSVAGVPFGPARPKFADPWIHAREVVKNDLASGGGTYELSLPYKDWAIAKDPNLPLDVNLSRQLANLGHRDKGTKEVAYQRFAADHPPTSEYTQRHIRATNQDLRHLDAHNAASLPHNFPDEFPNVWVDAATLDDRDLPLQKIFDTLKLINRHATESPEGIAARAAGERLVNKVEFSGTGSSTFNRPGRRIRLNPLADIVEDPAVTPLEGAAVHETRHARNHFSNYRGTQPYGKSSTGYIGYRRGGDEPSAWGASNAEAATRSKDPQLLLDQFDVLEPLAEARQYQDWNLADDMRKVPKQKVRTIITEPEPLQFQLGLESELRDLESLRQVALKNAMAKRKW